MNPYDAPQHIHDHGNLLIRRSSPPPIVRLSVAGLALSFSLGIAKMVYLAYQNGSLRLVGFCIGTSFLLVILYVLLRSLYRGSKVAFWIVIAHAAFAIVAYRYSITQFARLHTQWEKALFLFQGVIQLLSAAALISPQSWRWFHIKTPQAEQVVAADRQ